MQLWAISKVHVKAGNATDRAAAQALQQGITVKPATYNVTKPLEPSLASPAKDLIRRAAAASAQPYELWGADRGAYMSKGDTEPVNMPGHIYKVDRSAFQPWLDLIGEQLHEALAIQRHQ